MILFKPIPYFDKKYQVIGKCISGSELLEKIEQVQTAFERPTKKIKVVDCGVL
jgi:cyclophilin family peptidyl-prolyl cis-trans isomerase